MTRGVRAWLLGTRAVGPRRFCAGRRGVSGLLALGIVACMTVASTQSAQAFVGVPPVPTLPVGLLTSSGVSVGTLDAGAALGSMAGLTGAATATAAATGVITGGFAVGYGIGWAGQKGLSVVWDKWFTEHPSVDGTVCGGGFAICYTSDYPTAIATVGKAWGFEVTRPNGGGWLGFDTYCGGKMVVSAETDASNSNGRRYVDGRGLFYDDDCYSVGMAMKATYTNGNLVIERVLPGEVVMRVQRQAVSQQWWRIKSETDCIDSLGRVGTVTALSGVVSSANGADPNVPEALCASGTHAVGGRTWMIPTRSDGVATGAPIALTDWQAPPRALDVNDPDADCLSRAGDRQCTLQPVENDPQTGAPRPYAPPEVNPSTGEQPKPDGCLFGARVLAASECEWMWNPKTSTPADPSASPSPSSTPVAPQTGQVTDPSQPGSPGKSPSGCWPKGWGIFNPLEWVYKPVVCALDYAFVPKATTISASTTKVRDAWGRTGADAWGQAVGAVPDGMGKWNAGGCEGPVFHFPIGGKTVDLAPLNACSSPMDKIAVVVKVFLSASIVVGGAYLCARPILAALGMAGALNRGSD